MTDHHNTGVVKWFHPWKGYGFIDVDGRKHDAFVHESALKMKRPYPTLDEGDRVTFTLQQSSRGLAAVNVVRLPH